MCFYRTLRWLLLGLGLWLGNGLLFAQNDVWVPTGGPFGGTDVHAFARHPEGDLFAATIGGLFRSVDEGQLWSQVDTGFGVSGVTTVLVDATGVVWAGTEGAGLYRSFDRGAHWGGAGLAGISVTTLAAADGMLLAGTTEGLVYRGLGGGAFWLPSAPLADGPIAAVAFADTLAVVGTADGLFHSADSGITWAEATGTAARPIGALAHAPDGAFIAGTDDGRLLRSADGGRSWDQWLFISDELPVRTLRFDAQGNLLVGTWGGILLVNRDGLLMAAYVFGSQHVEAIALTNDGGLIGGTLRDGIFRSDAERRTWGLQNEGLTSVITALTADPEGPVYAAASGSGVFRSDDRGATWTPLARAFGLDFTTALALAPNGTLYAATAYGDIHELGEDGRWVDTGGPGGAIFRLIPTDDGTLFAAATHGLFRRPPSGTGWLPTSLSGFEIFAIATDHAEGLYAAIRGRVMYSSDGGTSWFPTTLTQDVQALTVSPDGTVYAALTEGGLMRSLDLGGPTLQWESLDAALPTGDVRAFTFTRDAAYAATHGHGVYRSTNGGLAWTALTDGLTHPFVDHLAIGGDGTLYAGTRGGSVYRFGGPTTTAREAGPLPGAFALEPNHPNPFNPTTTLAFTLPAAAHATVVVYDLLGREVARVLDAFRPAGRHTVRFDAAALPSGRYLYRLQASPHTATRLMTLVK